jgi:SRSO17 transposase
VLADAAYGINTEFREGLTKLGLQYVVGVQSSMTVWEPGKQPLPAKRRGKMGRTPRLLQRTADHQPVSDCPLLASGKSPGVKAQTGSCNPALPPFAYALLIGIIGRRSLTGRDSGR